MGINASTYPPRIRGGFLIKYCDEKSKGRRKEAERVKDDVVHVGKCTVMVNKTPCDKSIREVVWEIDACNSSIDAIVSIFGEK